VINPAFAGADEALSLTLVYRNQWTGLDGSPSTQTLSGHSLFKRNNFGLGASIVNDKVGIHQNLSINTSYAYHLQIRKDTYISMGLQVGFYHNQSDFGSLNGHVQNPNDPSISQFKQTSTFPEVGTGFSYRDPKLHLGISALNLIPNNVKVTDSLSVDLNEQHYFLYGRYRIPIGRGIKLQPGLLVKYLPGLPLSYDFHLSAIFNEVLLTGLSYRSFESIDLVLQAKLTPQLKFGYNYDYPIGKVGLLSHSSHELMLNYIFKYSKYKIKRPR
jgi:type IX secretion system PorP/SprF family membrane protein